MNKLLKKTDNKMTKKRSLSSIFFVIKNKFKNNIGLVLAIFVAIIYSLQYNLAHAQEAQNLTDELNNQGITQLFQQPTINVEPINSEQETTITPTTNNEENIISTTPLFPIEQQTDKKDTNTLIDFFSNLKILYDTKNNQPEKTTVLKSNKGQKNNTTINVTSEDIKLTEQDFIDGGYTFESGAKTTNAKGKYIGKSSFKIQNKKKLTIPLIFQSTNGLSGKVAEIEIPANIYIKDKKGNSFTNEINSPEFINPLKYNLSTKAVKSLIKVGNDTESVFFTQEDGSTAETATIKMPAPGYKIGENAKIYSSEDGKTRTFHTTAEVQKIDNSPYVVFQTTHFTLFAVGSIQRNNDDYLTEDFWNNNPTNDQIIRALYGGGSGSSETTAYTKNWTEAGCITGNMAVIHLTGGNDKLASNLAANTIYALSSGTYTTSQAISMNKCSAIIGKTGTVNLYSNIQLSNSSYGLITIGMKYTILDNLNIDGINRAGFGTHGSNYYGIKYYLGGVYNNTINKISSYNNLQGINIEGNSPAIPNTNIIINNSQFYNNSSYGINTRNSKYIIMNNILTYNNNIGILLGSASSYNTLNNIQTYNNNTEGLSIEADYNTLNNIQTYNNNSRGILIYSSNNIFNQINVQNNTTGISFNTTSTGNKYYGTLKLYENDSDRENSGGKISAGNSDDYILLGWTGGSIDTNPCFRCANITNPINTVSGSLTNTGIYRSCSFRGQNTTWIPSTGENINYIYGTNIPKQIIPVSYTGTTLMLSSIPFSGNLYIGETNKIGENNDTICSNCSGNYSANRDNSNFLSGDFWSQNPNSCDIVSALYGTGLYGEDTTAYSQYWTGAQNGNICDTQNMRVVTVNPGTNTLPTQLSNNTIYVLEPGTYITNDTIYTHGCNAIIGKNGTGTFYSSAKLNNGIFLSRKDNNIYENLIINGTGNGIGGSHSANSYGIYMGSFSSFYSHKNTINNIQTYNNTYGISLNNANYNYINNTEVYNNGSNGINIQSSNYNIINKSKFYGNYSFGIQMSSSSYNTIDKSKFYGNGNTSNGAGISLNAGSSNIINEVESFNNKGGYSNGLEIAYSTKNTIQKVITYGNGRNGIYLNNSDTNYLDNIQTYNNLSHGIEMFGGNGKTIFNNIQIYNNSNGIKLAGTNNAINNSQIYNNNQYGLFYITSNNTINNSQIYNNGTYGLYIYGSNNIFNQTTILNNGTGMYFYSTSTGNKYYGTLKLYENDSDRDSSGGKITAGNQNDYPLFGRNDGAFNYDPCFRCANVTNPSNLGSGNLTNTEIYKSCNSRGNINSWIPTTGEIINYTYGTNIPKQIAPVQYSGATLTGSIFQYSGDLYIGEANKTAENNDTTCSTCDSNYTSTWNNDNFLSSDFWNQNPNSCDIIAAVYGTGIYGEDQTAYSKYRSGAQNGNYCDIHNMSVINLSPGTNILPSQLSSNTIYILNPGTYISNSTINTTNCNAIITKNGTGNFYSNIQLGILFNSSQRKNNIFENITVDGTGNGIGGIHTRNNNAIVIGGFNTLNNIEIFNNLVGFTSSSSYNYLNNIKSYNNTSYGLYLQGSSYNYLNNIQSYNNPSYGIYIYGSTYNTINNIKVFNNNQNGIYLYNGSTYNTFNNVESYLNKQIGLYLENASNTTIYNGKFYSNSNIGLATNSQSINNTFNNIQSYNNNSQGISLGSSNNNLNNIQSYNNGIYGINISNSNNAINNLQAYNNDSYGVLLGGGLSNSNVLNNIQSYNNTYGLYIQSTSNNFFNNITLLNNTTGIIIGGTSTGNKYYGTLKLYENDNDREGTGRFITGNNSDYSYLGWIEGFSDYNPCFRCANITNPTNISSGQLTNTGIYWNCNSRGKNTLWKPGTGETINYTYGTNIPKQIKPVQYTGSTITGINLPYSGNLYIGEIDKIGENNDTTCNNCSSQYSTTWNNDNYLSSDFWSQSPNSCDITAALYGTGLYGEDQTAYTQYQSGKWICDVENMRVFNISPGTNVLPSTLPNNTVYVLSSGLYITSGTIKTNNCNAVVTKNGNGLFYSTINLTYFFNINKVKNNIFESIVLDGSGNGVGGSHTKNGNAFYLRYSDYNTINNIQTYNNDYGFNINSSNYNNINNIETYNNNSFGFYMIYATNNLFNNINSYKNGSFGVEVGVASNYNSFNNIKSYNNTQRGLDISSSNYNFYNNIELYNNQYGLYTNTASYNTFENIRSFNNSAYGALLNTFTYNKINNLQLYKNAQYGLQLFNFSNNKANNIKSFNNGSDGIYIIYNSINNTITNAASFNNTGNGISLQGQNTSTYPKNNAINNSLIFNNKGKGIYFYNPISGNTINNTSIYNNNDYGIYLSNVSPMNNNLFNNLNIYNNSGGIYIGPSATGNYIYGKLNLFNNDSSIDGSGSNLLFGSGSTYASLGMTTGQIITTGILDRNILINPKDELNNYLLPWTDTGINLRGRKPFTGTSLLFSYGPNIPRQTQPLAYSGSTLIQSGSFDSGKYIGTDTTAFSGQITGINLSSNSFNVPVTGLSEQTGFYTLFGDLDQSYITYINSGITITLSPSEGIKNIIAQFYDSNNDPTHYLYSTTVNIADTQSPVVQTGYISSGFTGTYGGQKYFKGPITIRANVSDDVGVNTGSCEYSITGVRYQASGYTSYCEVTNLITNTDISIQFRIQDNIGNIGTGPINTYIYDQIAPSKPTITFPTTNSNLNNGTFTLQWTTSIETGIGISGYIYQISTDNLFSSIIASGSTVQTGQILFNMNDGVYFARVYANDNLNNTGDSSDITTFSIDTAAPTIIFTGYTPSNNSTITSNTFSGIAEITETNLYSLIRNWNGINYPIYDSGLVLMMNFDNVASIGENSTITKDISIYGNHGINSGATWITDGIHKGAFDFNGTSNYVTINDSESLALTGAGSISVRLKIPSQRKGDTYPNVVSKGGNSGRDSYGRSLYAFSDNRIGLGGRNGTTTEHLAMFNNTIKDKWTHIVATREGSGGIINIYQDNQLKKTKTQTFDFPITTEKVIIGKGLNGAKFGGQIDELRIYNRALSTDEIKTLYTTNLAKINTNKRELSSTHSCLIDSGYTYNITANDSSNTSTTGRNITVTLPNPTIGTPTYGLNFPNISSKIQEQTIEQVFTGDDNHFWIYDTKGYTGRYTTIQLSGDLSNSNNSRSIPKENILFKANNSISTLEGTTSSAVTLATGINEYKAMTGIYNYIIKNNTNECSSCIVGKYGNAPSLKVVIPPLQKADTYNGTFIFTLYN